MTVRTPISPRGFYATMPTRSHGQASPYAIEPLRVLIVEDHQLLAETLARSLSDEPDIAIVGLARTVADALDRFRMGPVDVVLLDYNLPDGDGLVVARHILREHPGTHVIMVTAREDREMVRAALGAGCTGFIGKSESFVHLPNAIRSASQGTTAISPAVAAMLVADAPVAAVGADALTEREAELLRLLATGHSSADVADALFVSQHTLRNYLNHINVKLDTHSKLEAVAKALRLGLIALDGDKGEHASAAGRRRKRS